MKTKLIYFIFGTLVSLGVLTAYNEFYAQTIPEESAVNIIRQNDANTELLEPHTLSLPLIYFSQENLYGGSVGSNGKTDDHSTWANASFDGGYRSFPTTTITFTDYMNEVKQLPLPENNEWQNELEKSIFNELLIEQAAVSDVAARLSFKGQLIYRQQEADVNLDGVPELILSIDTGGNHPPLAYYIVEGKQIIFTGGFDTLLLSGIEPSSDGNGFTLNWVDNKHLIGRGLCCALGYTSTRFIHENGEFRPIYEQDNRYFKVENIVQY